MVRECGSSAGGHAGDVDLPSLLIGRGFARNGSDARGFVTARGVAGPSQGSEPDPSALVIRATRPSPYGARAPARRTLEDMRRGPQRWFFDVWSLVYDQPLVQRAVHRPPHDTVLAAMRDLTHARARDGRGVLGEPFRWPFHKCMSQDLSVFS